MPAHVTTESVWTALAGQMFAVLSWVSPQGFARSAGIVYLVRNGKLVIGAESTSWKARHIRANPKVSMTVTFRRRIALLPWIQLPDATVTFHGTARVIDPAGVDADILHELEKGMVDDPERVANTCLIEVSPEGDFLTYGIGVSVLAMRDPHKAQGRAPVT